ncbi:MAG: methyltransferase domain-containing protein [Hyphomicrobiaceae bacterium]
MHVDVSELRDFYATPLGQVVRRLVMPRIRSRWTSVRGETIVGLGYAVPYLGSLRRDEARVAALMPASQGAVVWPRQGGVLTALVEEDRLPLGDTSVDKLLVVHALECAERIRPLLREMWRVLAPAGSLIIIVPNRRGLWARLDTTPFGQGRPFSRRQIVQLLEEAMFTPVGSTSALFLPPFDHRLLVRSAVAWERLGARVTPGFAGLLIVEARKEMIATVGKAARVRSVQGVVAAAGSRLSRHDVRQNPGSADVSAAGATGTPPSRRTGSADGSSS